MNVFRHALLGGLLAAPLLTTGCLATYGQAELEQEAALRADLALVQDANRKLQGRMESLELQMEQLQRSMESLRQAPDGASAAEVQALQAKVNALEVQIRSVDAAREKDRQEIISSLTTKISQIVGGSGGARPRPAAATPRRAAGPQEGVEHVVEAGQTLSAIASAYGVSSKAIIEANNLDRPDQLRVGQKLFIPSH